MNEQLTNAAFNKYSSYLLEVTDYREFSDLVQRLSDKKWLFREEELNSIIASCLKRPKTALLFKDFLVKTHAVSILWDNAYIRANKLRQEYISNLNDDQIVGDEITSFLETRLKSILGPDNNFQRRINIRGIRSDWKSFANSSRIYTHNAPHVNRSVIIASLHDALLCRNVGENRLSQYFNDDAYSEYFIISDEKRKGLTEIQSVIGNYLNFLKNPNENNVKEMMSISVNPIESVVPIRHELSSEEVQWTKVFDKISEDASTLTIRKNILPKVAGYLKKESVYEAEEFNNAVRNIAAAYVKNNIEGLMVPSVMRQIEDVNHHMFCHDCNIFATVRNILDDDIITPARVNELVIAMYKAYMKVHFKFLNRLGKRYHPFYYILIKSYMITIGNPSRTYSDSLFKIIKVILEIRLNDVDLLKAVA